jgi:predicted RNA-binding protein (virulence factor B family)
VGDRHPFALVLDDTDRLAATMQIAERLRAPVAHAVGTWVEGEAWRNEPEIGLFVIVDKTCVGLVPRDEPHRVSRGDRVRARITRVHADGKFELSLRAAAHEALADDAAIVRDVLTREPTLRIGDGSSPREIRAWFGLSKKAFKRAVGRLLKDGHAKLGEDGSVVLVA